MKNKFLLSSLFGVTAALVLGLAAAPKATIETIAPLRQQGGILCRGNSWCDRRCSFSGRYQKKI